MRPTWVGWPREEEPGEERDVEKGKSGGSSGGEGRNKKMQRWRQWKALGSERDRQTGKMGQTKALKKSKGQEPGFNPWLGTKISHTA